MIFVGSDMAEAMPVRLDINEGEEWDLAIDVDDGTLVITVVDRSELLRLADFIRDAVERPEMGQH